MTFFKVAFALGLAAFALHALTYGGRSLEALLTSMF